MSIDVPRPGSLVLWAKVLLRSRRIEPPVVIEDLPMHVCLKKQFYRLASLAALLAVMAASAPAHGRTIDLNSNGTSDI